MLGDAWVPCDSAVYSLTSSGHLSPAEARRGVRVLLFTEIVNGVRLFVSDLAYLWLCTPESVKGRLCEDCAKQWRARLEVMRAEAHADEVCGECVGTRGTHEWTCGRRLGSW